MRLRKATHPALTLLLVAGLGVCVTSARTQSAAQKKSTASKSGNSTRRARSSKKLSRREPGQKVPTPDRISEIQQALAKDGSYSGTPNGKWDDSTMEATRKFQEAHGLNATGKLDAKTLQKLGLGSQTTGVAPPVPPISSSAATITPPPTVRRHQ
jgi:peptidoglycan hydrolase-like protein with peptidoglycan-binding domain